VQWHPLVVARVVQETPLDRTFVLGLPREGAEAFRFRPGQFITVRDPELDADGGRPLQRAYSISSSPSVIDHLEVTVRDSGSFGDRFYHFPPGKRLLVRPPQGRFVLEVEEGQHLLLAGGGSGVAPYRSFVRHLVEEGHTGPVVLLSSAREPDQLLFHEEMRATAARHGWFAYEPTVTRAAPDDPWPGRRGRLDEALLRELVGPPERAVVYACGPTAFVEAVLEHAAFLGLPADRLRREKWG
jgi:ferredoxin-NADP reductase